MFKIKYLKIHFFFVHLMTFNFILNVLFCRSLLFNFTIYTEITHRALLSLYSIGRLLQRNTITNFVVMLATLIFYSFEHFKSIYLKVG